MANQCFLLQNRQAGKFLIFCIFLTIWACPYSFKQILFRPYPESNKEEYHFSKRIDPEDQFFGYKILANSASSTNKDAVFVNILLGIYCIDILL